jgi:hypothetical protein
VASSDLVSSWDTVRASRDEGLESKSVSRILTALS